MKGSIFLSRFNIVASVALGAVLPVCVVILQPNVFIQHPGDLFLSFARTALMGFWSLCTMDLVLALRRWFLEINSPVGVQGRRSRRVGAGCISILKPLRWLFGQASREIIELAMADLERDRKEMMEEGCSPLWIQLCLLWGASRSVVPIVWDGCLRALTECAKAAKLLRTIIGRR